jgi:hypothetical protein
MTNPAQMFHTDRRRAAALLLHMAAGDRAADDETGAAARTTAAGGVHQVVVEAMEDGSLSRLVAMVARLALDTAPELADRADELSALCYASILAAEE